MRPIVVAALLAVLLPAFAGAQFIASFNSLDEPFFQGGNGRVSLNASCFGYDSEYLQGDLVRYKVEVQYPPSNATTILKQSYAIYVEPCSDVANQVFLLSFPMNATSVVLKASFARADYPASYYPVFFTSSFAVKPKPVATIVNASSVAGELSGEPSNPWNFKFPKPDWVWMVGAAAIVIGLLLLLWVRSLKWGFLFLLAGAIALGYYSFA